MTDRPLAEIIEGCLRNRETAMQAFYERFYGYALSVYSAYASDHEDAREMLNDGFLKVFLNLNELKNDDVLLPWLRRIMVNIAIDYYRKNRKQAATVSTESVAHSLEEPYLNDETILARLSAEDILTLLHQLPLSYRVVFSLYVLEGYSYREIAGRLSLTESTSRAHLTEANRRLRRALTGQTTNPHERTSR